MLSNDRSLPSGPTPPGRPGEPPGGPSAAGRRAPGAASLARDWRIVAGIALLAAGLGLLHLPGPDASLFHAVNDLGPASPWLWSDLSVAGLGLSAWIYLVFDAQQRADRVARLLWILVVGGLVIHWIKHGYATPRPLAALGAGALTVIGEELRTHSMPSGHSAMAFAMLGLVAGEIAQEARSRRGATGGLAPSAWFALVAWAVLAAGIALSRMAVGAHWPADVLAGAGLGLAFAALAERAWPVGAVARLVERPWGSRAMAAAMLASAAAISATPRVLALLGGGKAHLAHQLDTGYPLAEPLQWALGLVALAGAVRWWMAASRRASGG